ncbi:MAG: TIR domain-containing protein [Gammaproteobacteria bacterium]|nr:TIR domain-containing protein [Gammaproteobacteria bacterium]
MANNLKNIFISHVHEDDDGLRELKKLLDANGMTIRDYSVSADNPNNAKSEDYIKSEILAPRIRQCSTLVVYVSPETKDSAFVDWEIEYAEKEDKRIVGVWEHGENGCELPEALEKYADAIVGWTGNRIVDAINGKVDGIENPDGSLASLRDIKRYSCASG